MYTSVLVSEPQARLGHNTYPHFKDTSVIHPTGVRRTVSADCIAFTFEGEFPEAKRTDLPPFSCKRKDQVVFVEGVPSSIALELGVSVRCPLLVRAVHDDFDTIVSVPFVPRDKQYFAAEFPDTDVLIVEHLSTGRIILGPFHLFRRLNPFEKFMNRVLDFALH